jgi:molybdenum cofactor cytidylyltransferase
MSGASDCRRIGVILAAGRGKRMGGKKQITAWPSADGMKPLVACAYDAVRPICDEMVVVLGHIADSVVEALADRAFHRTDCDPDAPMYESIRAGLRTALNIDASATIVLQPCDHPEVDPTSLDRLAALSGEGPTQAIIPQYSNRGGHPVLIPPHICAILIEAECPEGLGQFWADHPELCHRVPIDDPKLVRDIDTPADLG